MGALKYYDTATSTWKYITNNPNTAGIILSEELTGVVNGTNTVFTTTQPFASIDVYKNGVHMRPGVGNDYTITGTNQITLATAPATGSTISASYATSGITNVAGVNSFIFKETPTGLVNGSNGVFTTARPYVPGSLLVHINGITQGNLVTETSPAAGTFTIDAPSTGDHVSVTYQYAASVSGNADTIDGYHASSIATANQILPLNGSGIYPQSVVQTSTLGYAQITSSFVGTSTVQTPITGLSTTVTVPSGGRRVKISVGARYMLSAVGPGYGVNIEVYDSTAGVVVGGLTYSNPVTNYATNPYFIATHIPPAGSRTYTVRYYTDQSASFTFAATVNNPGFILVELV